MLMPHMRKKKKGTMRNSGMPNASKEFFSTMHGMSRLGGEKGKTRK